MTKRGAAREWVENVALKYDGDECLPWPFQRNNMGYGLVCVDGAKRSAARYVCSRAHGAPPTPAHETAHSCGNGNKACCTKRHLSWKTPKANAADKKIHGTDNDGPRNGNVRLTPDEVRAIKRSTARGVDLAEQFGISKSRISEIRNGKAWKYLED